MRPLFLLVSFAAAATALTECPDDYELYEGGAEPTCIKIFTGHRYTWLESSLLCEKDGGHLVEIEDEAKMDYLQEAILGPEPSSTSTTESSILRDGRSLDDWLDQSDYWTNLVDIGSPGDFFWMSSRQPLGAFTNWMDDNPVDDQGFRAVILCNDAASLLRWRNFPPSHEALPICEITLDDPSSGSRFRRQRDF